MKKSLERAVAIDGEVEDLFVAGAGHSQAARALAGGDLEVAWYGPHSASIFLLVGFGLELTLKAAALHHGGDPRFLKFEVRHDLAAALAYAEAQGWKPYGPLLGELVTALNEVHRSNFFRYMSGLSDPKLPKFEPMLDVLNAHVLSVASELYC